MTTANPYTMRRTRVAYVEVLGGIWMPYGAKAATRYELSDYDLGNIGRFTRRNLDAWLSTHAGDFSSVIDFHGACGDKEIAWKSAENELAFCDCMYPAEA